MRLLPLALAAWCLATSDAWLPPLCQLRPRAAPSNLAAHPLQGGAGMYLHMCMCKPFAVANKSAFSFGCRIERVLGGLCPVHLSSTVQVCVHVVYAHMDSWAICGADRLVPFLDLQCI